MPATKKTLLLVALATLVVLAVVGVILVALRVSQSSPSSEALVGQCIPAITDEARPLSAEELLALGHENFTVRLYRALLPSESSLVASPVSLSSVLALASVGAKGSTLDELRSAASLPCQRQHLLDGYDFFLRQMSGDDGMHLNLANRQGRIENISSSSSNSSSSSSSSSSSNNNNNNNSNSSSSSNIGCRSNKKDVAAGPSEKSVIRIYVDDEFDLLPSFNSTGKRYFGASPERRDFSDDETRRSINAWVAAQTADRIKDLLPPGSLSAEMGMVLVNAVYFKGKWLRQFDKMLTEDRVFRGVRGEQKVKFMSLEAKFQTGRLPSTIGAGDMIKLPYVGERVSMYVILPDENATLAELEENFDQLDTLHFDDLLRKVPSKVILGLPRFKLETTHDLVPVINRLGATQMFLPDADFSGVSSSSSGLLVSDVVQKAFVEVSEEGTEAAAATGVTFRIASLVPPKEFICDRPFAFFIREEVTGMTLFFGRFVQP